MATRLVDVTGKSKYARLFEHNRDMGSKVSEGAKYDYPEATSLNVVLDQEELAKVSKVFTKVKPKVTEDGMEVQFKRRWMNSTNPAWGGEPKVKDAEGNDWDPKILIGNGSTVRVAAEVYDTKYGPAMRLLGVQVLELVEPDIEDNTPELPF